MPSRATKSVHQYWKKIILIFVDKKNLKRDAIILAAFCLFLAFIFIENQHTFFRRTTGKFRENIKQQEAASVMTDQQIYEEVRTIQEKISTNKWRLHQSQWYGIEIKYPETWEFPTKWAASRGSKWDYRFQFRKKSIAEGNPYIGFDVTIYDVAKTGELSKTEEFPAILVGQSKLEGECSNIAGHIIETGDYPAEEIYVPPADNCYKAALFFTNTKGAYIYNITPRLKDNSSLSGDPRVEITDNFPEFYSVISTFKLTDIVRPKPAPLKRVILAPMPVSYKIVGGRLVCAKENDRPAKSQKNKGKHMDMECCMDPDEYPNPHCYYPPDKYGKYL